MRLIDADALRFKNVAEVNGILTHILTADEIYNAPTASDRTEEVLSLQNTIAKLVEGIAENARPQGEWIYDDLFNNWKCSVCGKCPKTVGYVGDHDFMKEHFKFCNHCGAKMKGGVGNENN